MLLKYTPLGLEVELGGRNGLLALVPDGTVTAVNLSTGILIVHGWFYVVYLFSDFRLWSLMRWPFLRFVLIALGGVIPFLSFFLEGRIAREVKTYLATREAELAKNDTVEASH
jgi:integral membrane protein